MVGVLKMPRKILTDQEKEDRRLEREAHKREAAEEAERLRQEQQEFEKKLADEEQIEGWLREFQERFTDQPVQILVEKFNNGEWEICRKYPLASFDHDIVRQEFGGGRYRATLYDSHGKFVKEGRMQFKFADSLLPLIKPENPDPLANPAVALMIKSMENSQETLKSVLTTLAGTGGSKTSELPAIVEVMKTLGAITPRESPTKTMQDSLGLFVTIKDLFSDEKKSEGSGSLLSDLRDFVKIWPEIKEQFGNLPKLPAPGSALPALAANGHPVSREGPPADPLMQKIISLVPKFVEAARSNQPIPQWGAYLLEVFEVEILPLAVPVVQAKYKLVHVDEDMVYDGVIENAKNPAECEEVFKQIPPLAPYREWVNKVIAEAVRLAEIETPVDGSPLTVA